MKKFSGEVGIKCHQRCLVALVFYTNLYIKLAVSLGSFSIFSFPFSKLTCGRVFQHTFISKANLKNPEQGFLVHRFYLLRKQKRMSLSRPVFNLKAIEFGSFFAYFHLFRHLKVIQNFQKYAKTFYFRQAFRQKNRLKIALQVSKLGFSPIVMP